MELRELRTVSCYRCDEFGVSSIAFDLRQSILWAGTFGGHVSSYLDTELDKYSAFQAHQRDIRQLLPTEKGLVSITSKELRYTMHTGLPVFCINDESVLSDMQCLLNYNKDSVLVGCHNRKLSTLDLNLMKVTSEVSTSAGTCLLKASENYVCSGDVSGEVHLHDPSSQMSVVHSYSPHSGGLVDMEVVGHCVVTCGLIQQYGQMCVEGHLQVFDLRARRLLPSLSVTTQPLLLKHMPSSYGPTVLILSQMGEFTFVDLRGLLTPSTMVAHKLQMEGGAMASAVDVSPSGQCIAFGDSYGVVHLWGTGSDSVFNHYPLPSVMPDEIKPPPKLSFDDEGPDSVHLSAVPMPIPTTGEPLLSDWPKDCSKFVRRKAPQIDPEILSKMKVVDFVGYAPKPSHIRLNQVPYDLDHEPGMRVPESPMMREENPLLLIPKPYRQVQIKYSKLGIEGFDFSHYNDTRFAGLEIHIPNAYCNSMLQVLYFLEPIRCAMLNHTCRKECCLACELGFLFRMLDHSQGKSCQASNFLRVFRTLREAAGLGLLLASEEEERKAKLCQLIQKWNRFVLQQLNQEVQPMQGVFGTEECVPVVESVFGFGVETLTCCKMCGWSAMRQSTELLFTLSYPHQAATELKQQSFTSLLEYSICREQWTQAWCETCHKFKSTVQQKKLRFLPKVLSLNCNLESSQDRGFWQEQQKSGSLTDPWLPLSMKLSICSQHTLSAERLSEEESKSENLILFMAHSTWMRCGDVMLGPVLVEAVYYHEQMETSVVYDLAMLVGHVKEAWMEAPGNLIAHIRVGPSYHKRKQGAEKMQWYLFNDFVVVPLTSHSPAVFPTEWLVPCIIIYTQRGYESLLDVSVVSCLDPSLLVAETHQPHPLQSPIICTPLAFTECPKKGDLVGIDAEFVTLNQEEAEVKSDGTHTTLKPSQLALARITVVRGAGPMMGTPFIDDYIATNEQVVDYLTKFSGIKPGDLDATVSSKHLTTLKAAYLKLLYLQETGVMFVGHGLKKDFRVINMLVPPEQVLDTVEIFHLPKQRYVSLKFLSWFYLSIYIQEGNHDSAEDARTALLLYQKHQELQGKKTFSKSLQNLYDTGRKHKWQVPQSE